MKFLVITPTYNRAAVVLDAVNSVLNQDHVDWEYVIIDDCSEDETRSLIEPIASKHDNIHYIRNDTNQGTYRTRNVGLQFAIDNNIPWDIFTTIDSDDFCQSTRFSCALKYFSNDRFIGLRPVVVRSDIRDLTFEAYKNHQVNIPEGTAFYSRKCFEMLGYFDDVRMGGDSEYWERCARVCQISRGEYTCGVMSKNDPLYVAYKTPSNDNLSYQGREAGGIRHIYLSNFRQRHRQIINIHDAYVNHHDS